MSVSVAEHLIPPRTLRYRRDSGGYSLRTVAPRIRDGARRRAGAKRMLKQPKIGVTVKPTKAAIEARWPTLWREGSLSFAPP
jgi:hypothetical protein